MEHISKQLALRIPDKDPKVPPTMWFFAGAVVLFTLLLFTTMPGPKTYDHNVIIVAFDSLQAKHLHAYGYEKTTTPHLDAFIEKSYLFEKAVSPSSWTLPTYMSIFTSLYPSEHRLTNTEVHISATSTRPANVDSLRPHTIRLAQILKEAGYSTAAFTGGGLDSAYGYDVGFDTYDASLLFSGFDKTAPKAVAWLKENRPNKMFLFLQGYNAHGQYEPEGGLDYRYRNPTYQGPFTGTALNQSNLRERGLRNDPILLTPESQEFWNAVYDEKIARADAEFGTFMDTVESLNLMDDSIIIVLSSHGTELYEHKKFDYGHSLYGELLNVLLAIHVPKQTEGKRIDSLVSTLDVTPTILNLLGVSHSAQSSMRGIDLSKSFDDTDISRPIFSETDYRLYTRKRSVTTPDGWKLIVAKESGKRELYDLSKDPLELRDLSQREPVKLSELQETLDAHLTSVSDTGPWDTGCIPAYQGQCE